MSHNKYFKVLNNESSGFQILSKWAARSYDHDGSLLFHDTIIFILYLYYQDLHRETLFISCRMPNNYYIKLLNEIRNNEEQFVPGQKKVVWPPVPETNGYHQTPQVRNAKIL